MATSRKRIVGKYELGQVLATGHLDSRTRLCTHIVTGAQYVVRIFSKNVLMEAQWMWDRTRDAIHVMRTLPKHENIIETVECFETQTSLYILMQMFSPVHLTKMYTSEKESGIRVSIPIQKTKHYYSQMVCGLLHMHNNNVVHLGLAPDHVMVNNLDQVKIGFLISCTHFTKGKLSRDLRGTTRTVAPEVLRNEPYDPYLADAWSMGVILYFMLHQGRYPHDGANTTTKIKYHRIRPIDSNLPQDAIDLLSWLLHPNPSQRMRVEQIMSHPFLTLGEGEAELPSRKKSIFLQNERNRSIDSGECLLNNASPSHGVVWEKDVALDGQHTHEASRWSDVLCCSSLMSLSHEAAEVASTRTSQDNSPNARGKRQYISSSGEEEGLLHRRSKVLNQQRQLSRTAGVTATSGASPKVRATSATPDTVHFDLPNSDFDSWNKTQGGPELLGTFASTVMDEEQITHTSAMQKNPVQEKQAGFESRPHKVISIDGSPIKPQTSGGGTNRTAGEEGSIETPPTMIRPGLNACADAEYAAVASNMWVDPSLPCPLCSNCRPRQRLCGSKPYNKTSFVYKGGEYSLKVEE